MERKLEPQSVAEPLNVLLIGNNPIDMGSTLEKINKIKGRKIITEIAFDLRSIAERLMRFKPNFILIDDNIGRAEVSLALDTLSRTGKTKNIPITILKNSNYHESSTSQCVLDYVLKQNFSAETLYSTLRNSLKFKRTQLLLRNAYRRQKSKLKFLHSI
jgi:hypothetical protein